VKVRVVPVGLAVAAVLVAFNSYLAPTGAQLRAVHARVVGDETQSAAVGMRGTLLARIAAQQRALAQRLRAERPLEPASAEAHLLADLNAAATRSGVRLESFSARGAATPLAFDPAPQTSPVAVALGASAPGSARPGLAGLRFPREVVVEGSLAGILRFVDGLGRLRGPVRLEAVTLTQHARLQATIDFDLVVIDQATFQEVQG
jgi:hypothetical protein